MLLALWDEMLPTRLSDMDMLQLSRRHYSRHNINAKKLGGPARSLLLRDVAGDVLFLWQWPKDGMRRDKQNGYNCVMFRNESKRRSSDIILEAEGHAVAKWGKNRFYTYVDARKVKSVNPGYCFKMAGWQRVGRSKTGLELLVKESQ
jgi:hypothetical protein